MEVQAPDIFFRLLSFNSMLYSWDMKMNLVPLWLKYGFCLRYNLVLKYKEKSLKNIFFS